MNDVEFARQFDDFAKRTASLVAKAVSIPGGSITFRMSDAYANHQ